MMIVVAIIFVIAGMSIIALQPSLQQFRANAAMGQVKEALRQGHEYAISQRRTVAVTFTNDLYGNSEIVLNDYTVSNGVEALNNTPFLTVPIEPSVTFRLFNAMPDTPDHFGNQGPLAFNGTAYAAGTILKFQSDGTFTNVVGTPINGSVFMGIQNMPASARAVTILGSTGRIKGWSGANGQGWLQQ